MEATIHYGLDVAQYISCVAPNAKRIDVLMRWAKSMIDAHNIALDTPNYDVLVGACEHFGVEDIEEKRMYCRAIFSLCLMNRHQ